MFVLALMAWAASQSVDPARGESELRQALGDRVAGQPMTCVSPRFLRGSRIIDGTAIVYEGVGSQLYVQRPMQGADQLQSGDTIVSRSPLASLCRTDVVDLVDRGTRIRTGQVTYGQFVPYARRGSRR